MAAMKSVALFALLLVTPLASAARNVKNGEEACASEDLKHRALLQNKLAGICEGMCKEVQASPTECTCPNYVEPDSTPGVMTWDELLQYMDQLADWGRDSIKGWHKQASQLQIAQVNGTKTINSTKTANSTKAANSTKNATASAKRTCTAKVTSPAAVSLEANGVPHMVYGDVEFCGAGQLKWVEGDCKHQDAFDSGPGTLVPGTSATGCEDVVCQEYPCCMAFKCGTSSEVWER